MRTAPGRAVRAVLLRPELWATALRVGWRTAAPGWWRRWPPCPAPDGAYLRFRMETMYGTGGEGSFAGADVVAYLEWCRRHPGRAR